MRGRIEFEVTGADFAELEAKAAVALARIAPGRTAQTHIQVTPLQTTSDGEVTVWSGSVASDIVDGAR